MDIVNFCTAWPQRHLSLLYLQASCNQPLVYKDLTGKSLRISYSTRFLGMAGAVEPEATFEIKGHGSGGHALVCCFH
jgi:hypothetical protein